MRTFPGAGFSGFLSNYRENNIPFYFYGILAICQRLSELTNSDPDRLISGVTTITFTFLWAFLFGSRRLTSEELWYPDTDNLFFSSGSSISKEVQEEVSSTCGNMRSTCLPTTYYADQCAKLAFLCIYGEKFLAIIMALIGLCCWISWSLPSATVLDNDRCIGVSICRESKIPVIFAGIYAVDD